MGLYDDSEEVRKIGLWDRLPPAEIAPAPQRIAFAVGQIAEAMGFLEDTQKSDARYWAIKALIRAKDMLTTGARDKMERED